MRSDSEWMHEYDARDEEMAKTEPNSAVRKDIILNQLAVKMQHCDGISLQDAAMRIKNMYFNRIKEEIKQEYKELPIANKLWG